MASSSSGPPESGLDYSILDSTQAQIAQERCMELALEGQRRVQAQDVKGEGIIWLGGERGKLVL